jgi:hypothetical protein
VHIHMDVGVILMEWRVLKKLLNGQQWFINKLKKETKRQSLDEYSYFDSTFTIYFILLFIYNVYIIDTIIYINNIIKKY